MSIHVLTMVWSKGPENLKERMVLLAIADHANDSGSAFPGIELIAQKTCMDKRSVLRWLEVLEANGWMTIDRKSSGTGRKGNTYYLNLTKLGGALIGTELPGAATSVGSRKTTSRSGSAEQTGHVTNRNAQATKARSSGDKTMSPILINRQESSQKPSGGIPPRFKVGNASAKSSELCVLAADMLESLAIVAPAKTKHLAAEAIRLLAKSTGKTWEDAATSIEERGRMALERGATVNGFWFEDGRWKESKASPASIGVYRPDASPGPTAAVSKQPDMVAASAEELELGQRYWAAMQTAMKQALPIGKFDTWVRPIHAVGAVAGVLVLELPSAHFEGVDVRYQFNEYLVPELTQVRCVIAETLAA